MPSHNNDADTERKMAEFQRRKMQMREENLRQKTLKFTAPKFFNIARRPGARGK